MERWRNKKPTLKCKSVPVKKTEISEFTESVLDTNETLKDLELLNEPEESISDNDINSDIEELFRRSQRFEEPQEEGCDRRKRDKTRRHSKKKRRSRRTVRYSLSKPVSPETEQIIRVDVTSSIPIEYFEEIDVTSERLISKEYNNC